VGEEKIYLARLLYQY